MNELLKNMIKEEWRIHSTFFGGFFFALLPVMIMLFTALGSLLIPMIRLVFNIDHVVIGVHYFFFFLGLNVGAFGMFGSEIMNRRFGHASLLAYSSRTLPITEREIFVNFVVKDIFYYIIQWVLPFIAGFAIASPFIGIPFIYSFYFLVSLILSFMLGLSIIFLLSTFYAHSIRLLAGAIFVLVFSLFYFSNFSFGFLLAMPAYHYFITHSAFDVLYSLLIIIICMVLSFVFFKIDFPVSKTTLPNSFKPIQKTFQPFGFFSIFISKDVLDLWRTKGGVGRIIFSLIIPNLLIWAFITYFVKFIPFVNFLTMFSIFLGLYASSVYQWLTEYDLFASYSFLPIKASIIIKSKMLTTFVINFISLALLIIAAIIKNETNLIWISILIYFTMFIFALAITINLTGLYPNILLLNAWVFFRYLAFVVPVALVVLLMSVLFPLWNVIFCVLIAAVSLLIISRSIDKWDDFEQPSY